MFGFSFSVSCRAGSEDELLVMRPSGRVRVVSVRKRYGEVSQSCVCRLCIGAEALPVCFVYRGGKSGAGLMLNLFLGFVLGFGGCP